MIIVCRVGSTPHDGYRGWSPYHGTRGLRPVVRFRPTCPSRRRDSQHVGDRHTTEQRVLVPAAQPRGCCAALHRVTTWSTCCQRCTRKNGARWLATRHWVWSDAGSAVQRELRCAALRRTAAALAYGRQRRTEGTALRCTERQQDWLAGGSAVQRELRCAAWRTDKTVRCAPGKRPSPPLEPGMGNSKGRPNLEP